MKLFNNFKTNAQALAENARKNVDVKKLEFTIRNVKKENTLLYAQIGKLVYTCKKSGKPIVSQEIEDICAQIDGNRIKVAGLESKITELSAQAKIQQAEEDDITVNVAPISKNEKDLRLVRTEDGVRFMKFCPNCGGANEPDSTACVSCGYAFNKDN
jgi:ribosomal protein S27AE/Zn finger protein HypA/HybF involved in hydrogenase expression